VFFCQSILEWPRLLFLLRHSTTKSYKTRFASALNFSLYAPSKNISFPASKYFLDQVTFLQCVFAPAAAVAAVVTAVGHCMCKNLNSIGLNVKTNVSCWYSPTIIVLLDKVIHAFSYLYFRGCFLLFSLTQSPNTNDCLTTVAALRSAWLPLVVLGLPSF